MLVLHLLELTVTSTVAVPIDASLEESVEDLSLLDLVEKVGVE